MPYEGFLVGRLDDGIMVEIIDLSAGGIALKAGSRLSVGREYSMRLQEHKHQLEVRGTVVRSQILEGRQAVVGKEGPVYTSAMRLQEGSGLIAEVKLNVKSTHAERLMSEIGHIMDKTGLHLNNIDVFAVSIGPGSFTGLRIGVGAGKGFAYATGKPIVAVPTLEALAWNLAYSRDPVWTMFDARKKEVYAAAFRWEGDGFQRVAVEMSAKVDWVLE